MRRFAIPLLALSLLACRAATHDVRTTAARGDTAVPDEGWGRSQGDCVRPLDRGGGWYSKPESVRSSFRYAGEDPTRQNNTLGFRVVRSWP